MHVDVDKFLDAITPRFEQTGSLEKLFTLDGQRIKDIKVLRVSVFAFASDRAGRALCICVPARPISEVCPTPVLRWIAFAGFHVCCMVLIPRAVMLVPT